MPSWASFPTRRHTLPTRHAAGPTEEGEAGPLRLENTLSHAMPGTTAKAGEPPEAPGAASLNVQDQQPRRPRRPRPRPMPENQNPRCPASPSCLGTPSRQHQAPLRPAPDARLRGASATAMNRPTRGHLTSTGGSLNLKTKGPPATRWRGAPTSRRECLRSGPQNAGAQSKPQSSGPARHRAKPQRPKRCDRSRRRRATLQGAKRPKG